MHYMCLLSFLETIEFKTPLSDIADFLWRSTLQVTHDCMKQVMFIKRGLLYISLFNKMKNKIETNSSNVVLFHSYFLRGGYRFSVLIISAYAFIARL